MYGEIREQVKHWNSGSEMEYAGVMLQVVSCITLPGLTNYFVYILDNGTAKMNRICDFSGVVVRKQIHSRV